MEALTLLLDRTAACPDGIRLPAAVSGPLGASESQQRPVIVTIPSAQRLNVLSANLAGLRQICGSPTEALPAQAHHQQVRHPARVSPVGPVAPGVQHQFMISPRAAGLREFLH